MAAPKNQEGPAVKTQDLKSPDADRRVERTSRTETAVALEDRRRTGLIFADSEEAKDHPALGPLLNGVRNPLRTAVASRDSTFEADNPDWEDFPEESTTNLPGLAPEDLSHTRDDKPLGMSSAKTLREQEVEKQQEAAPQMPQGVVPQGEQPRP